VTRNQLRTAVHSQTAISTPIESRPSPRVHTTVQSSASRERRQTTVDRSLWRWRGPWRRGTLQGWTSLRRSRLSSMTPACRTSSSTSWSPSTRQRPSWRWPETSSSSSCWPLDVARAPTSERSSSTWPSPTSPWPSSACRSLSRSPCDTTGSSAPPCAPSYSFCRFLYHSINIVSCYRMQPPK